MYTEFKNPFETNPTYSLSTTSHDEHMPKDAPRIHSVPNPNGNLIPETAGTSKRITWKSNYHLFEIDLKEAAVFRDNTSIFPGWQARIDGQTTPLIQDPYYRLSVNIPAGKHQAEFLFRETTYRQIANFATLGGILLLILSAFSTIFTPKSKK
jgi:uncharacterized membrane protein YfhO